MTLSTLGLVLTLLACRDLLAPLERLRATSASPYLSGPGTVVVYPDSMRGWVFYNDQQDAVCTDSAVCRMISGPATTPLGSGSAELATTTTADGKALILADYKGVRLDQLTSLSYSTYRQTADVGNNLAISLQFNADFDLSDSAVGYQGRLVYEPYLTNGGGVVQNDWQVWDAKAGKWWGTKSTVSRAGVNVSNPCVQSSPCTWSQLLAAFPNAGIHATYGAVVLKAGSGWSSFRGNVDQLTVGIMGSTTTFDFELEPPTSVPASAPDSVPAALWDSLTAAANVLADPPGYAGHMVRDALLLAFRPSATLAERARAITQVGGRVVGGLLIGSPEHVYVIRIPYVLQAGDSASGPVLRAAATLRNLASVQLATPIATDPLKSYYRRPNDGPDFRAWPLSRDSLVGTNWAQVGVNGPMAWGCSTGDYPGETRPLIGIVDQGFHNITDLQGNLGSVTEFASATDTVIHGLQVASIVGAVGGNGVGMTGMLWHARMNLYNNFPKKGNDTTFTLVKAALAVFRAINDSAKVINISWGINPAVFRSGHPVTAGELQYLADRTDEFRLLVDGARDPVTGTYRTLFVVAAGNNQASAMEAGWPALASDPGRGSAVIAVADTYRASDHEQKMDPQSNSGPMVQIAAPGDDVATLNTYGGIAMASGTSFAAPLVTGAAGLLFAFDPGLTADSVKALLLAGAMDQARLVNDVFDPLNPKPVLDVYGSLRLAAQRTNAPLCGNRVLSSSTGDVLAERNPSPSPLERLFTSADAPYTDLLNSLHGGRRIQIGDYLEYKWSPADRSWSLSTFDGDYHEDAGGAFLSWYDGSDHDATRYLVDNGVLNQGSVYFTPQLFSLPAQAPLGAMSQVILPVKNMNGALACSIGPKDSLVTYANCPQGATTFVGSWEYPSGVSALSPQGDFALLGISYRSIAQSYASVYGNGGLMPTTANMRDTSVSIELWRVDSISLHQTRQPERMKITLPILTDGLSRDGLEIAWLAIDETGTEMVWELRKNVADYSANRFSCTNRIVEYRALRGHAPDRSGLAQDEGALLQHIDLPDLPEKCPSSFGPSTFSPFRGSIAARAPALTTSKSARVSRRQQRPRN